MNDASISRRSLIALASATAVAASLGVAGSDARMARATTLQDVSVRPCIMIFSAASETALREVGMTVDLASVGAGEYPSFFFAVRNNAAEALDVQEAHVTVDGGEPWGWGPHAIEARGSALYHVYYDNMQTVLSEGEHAATLSINGQDICSAAFTVTQAQDWGASFPLPSRADIDAANAEARCQAPYVAGCLGIPDGTRYISYSIDFKADAAPVGTYCCLAQWGPDLAGLRRVYPDARCDYDTVGGYAGLQHRSQGDWVSILSFWDVHYTDETGVTQTLRARLVYPEPNENDSFTGEGTGAHRIVAYPWQEGRWYRMQLRCSTSDAGTTLVDQWICDLTTGEWTRLACYDTGLPEAALITPGFFFLEDYDTSTCGEVRSMEVANIRLTSVEDETQEVDVTSAWLGPNGGEPTYSGSYAYGAQGNRFWAITSGAGGDWYGGGRGQTAGWYSVQ